MDTTTLLATLHQVGVVLTAEGERLRCNAPKGVLSPALRDELARRKPEILERLRLAEGLPQAVATPQQRYAPFPITDIQAAYLVGRDEAFELGRIATHGYVEIDFWDVDLARLNRAWQRVIDRHEMLRAVVNADGTQQVIENVPPYEFTVTDVRGQPEAAIQAALDALRAEMSHQVFATDQWPLFDLRAVYVAGNRFRLFLSIDILIADILSLMLLITEWSQFYDEPALRLPPLDLTFRDYMVAEHAIQETEHYRRAHAYWWAKLADLPPAPELPLARAPGSLEQPRFVRRHAEMDAATWQQLQRRARQAGITQSGVLLAAYAEVLSAWSKHSRFTLNLTRFNRFPLHPQVNDIVGDFTSVSLFVVDNSEAECFAARARRLQTRLWQDLDHPYVSGVQLIRELARRRGGTAEALMPVVFTSALVLGSFNLEQLNLYRQSELVYSLSQTSQVWLDHQAMEQDGRLAFNWDAVEDLFPAGMLDDMFTAYCGLLWRLATTDSAWNEAMRSLAPPAQLLHREAVNATAAPVSNALLHTLVARQVAQQPDALAVIDARRTLTYGELWSQACRVGQALRARGVKPNTLVAVVMHKGWEQSVGVLGILLAGAAYLPISPDLPEERIHSLLARGEATIALTQRAVDAALCWPDGVERLCVDDAPWAEWPASELPAIQSCTDIAYVIFTSGSTGQPKGVVIDHRGAVNTILDLNERFAVGAQDRVLALSSLSFDLSVYDIFGTLAAGGCIVVPDAAMERDPAHWAALLERHAVTVWNSVPALAEMLVDHLDHNPAPNKLRLVMLSGDWIPVALPDRIRACAPHAELFSLGGATEASIWSILYPIETVDPAWKSIPYGKPMVNQSFHVLDDALEPRPVWVPGNLYIGGIGLAQGYWRDAEKTAASFITHPRTGERLYKTGDLGRYLPDGNIEFLGREDFQVKIRGFRIELGEIEVTLEQHPAVERAVVTAAGDSKGARSLVAYVVPKTGQGATLVEPAATPSTQRWDALVQAGVRQAEHLPGDPVLAAMTRFWQVTEQASLHAIEATLAGLGFFTQPGEQRTLNEIVREAQITPANSKLVAQWLHALVKAGSLQQIQNGADGDGFACAHPLAADGRAGWDEAWRLVDGQPWGEALLHYFEVSVANHAGLLRGEVDALPLFFPDGDWQTAESLYQLNPLSVYYNSIAAALLDAAVRGDLAGGRPLRVLEVGAGTGSLTWALLPGLPAGGAEYTFTDLSTFFTDLASAKFADYPFVRYDLYNIDRPPNAQGYAGRTYDVIAAANVLHDARHIDASLGHLRSLLAPGGLLLIIEATEDSVLQMASLRFLEGFSHYEDERIQTHSPLLSTDGWAEALKRNGFDSIASFPGASVAPVLRRNHVILAQGGETRPAPTAIDLDSLAAYVRRRLPEYMAPAQYVVLDALPLSANGKVDRKALPAVEAATAANVAEFVAPGSATERQIAAVWCEVLHLDQVGIHDNFFALGGDSLLATRAVSRMRQVWGEGISLRRLFEWPTLAGLAAQIDALAPVAEYEEGEV